MKKIAWYVKRIGLLLIVTVFFFLIFSLYEAASEDIVIYDNSPGLETREEETLELTRDHVEGAFFIDSPQINQVTQEGWAELFYEPINEIHIYGDSDELVARLWVEDDVLKFEGELCEGAKLFFEFFLKPIVDNYIREKLKEQQ